MRKILPLSIIAFCAVSFSVFADTGDVAPPAPLPISPQVQQASPADVAPASPASPAPTTPSTPPLNAAPNPGATLAPTNRMLGTALGEFKSVSCNSNPAFATNSCDQCFDGGSVKQGSTITGLYDNWLNNTENILVAYKEEQKMPNMVRFGNTTWTANPADETKFWKYSSDVLWVSMGSGGKNQYILPAKQSVKFLESDLVSGYKLDKTDKKDGEVVGILRFPLVSHTIDTSANESAASTSYECAAFTVSSSAPTVVPSNKPTPKDITSTKTGPETLLLIVAAFFIAFGLMFSLRRRV